MSRAHRSLLLASFLSMSVSLVATAGAESPADAAAVDPATVTDNGADPAAIADAVARAEGAAADEGAAVDDSYEQSLGLTPKRGVISLPNGITQVDVPDSFFYLSPADAEKVLVEWGNPPGTETLGMLVPADTGIGSEESWAVVITYDDGGHVADDDAAEIDYHELLIDMQADSKDENEARKDAGFGAVDLVGWAEDPHYDAATHKIYWAKRLRFEDNEGDTLNYGVRVLGREGVLELNAVAQMDQFRQVRDEMPAVISMASFKEGQRYEDFNESTDHMAAYGLAALVAGGVAAKVGVFAKLFALLLAFKKLVILGVVAVGAFFAQLFKRKGSIDA